MFLFIGKAYAMGPNLDSLNKEIGLNPELTTVDGILNQLLPYIIVLCGLILLGLLIAGGFQIMTAVQNPDQASAGKAKIGAAVVGFALLFSAYWIAQILQIIFGISILGS